MVLTRHREERPNGHAAAADGWAATARHGQSWVVEWGTGAPGASEQLVPAYQRAGVTRLSGMPRLPAGPATADPVNGA